MRFFGFVSRHMIAKVFLAVALVVSAALLFSARREAQGESDTLKQDTRRSAETVARMMIGAVRQTMLQGDGLQVKALVASMARTVPDAQVHIYDQRGIEVFAPKPPPPPTSEIPAPVRATLADERRRVDGGTVYHPLPTEDRCRACHHEKADLRGVLAIAFDRRICADRREDTLATLVKDGFLHIMTARKSNLLDDYFSELTRAAPAVRGAAVYDAAGDLAFGSEIAGVTSEQITGAARPDGAPLRVPLGDGSLDLIPLPMQDRCVACHSYKQGKVRGVLALALAPRAGTGCETEALEAVIDRSLRYIMLSRLGRRIADFLDAAAATGSVSRLELFDNQGRRYWSTHHDTPPAGVARVLAQKSGLAQFLGEGDSERTLVDEPLHNDKGCMRCHGGGPGDVRGVVSVSMSTADAAHMRMKVIEQRALFSAGTLLAILVMLIGVLQYVVLRPVRQIGTVADAVSEGKLDVVVKRAREDGDEVARLGHRINHMVSGLRAKTQLERFVSRGAAAAAHEAGQGLRGVARTGERRAATVLFSDIRGFTAFSERVSPEKVVEMLNRVLDAQAQVVVEHGGDIDKFVGDELMAVFQGPGAELRAVRCAVAMVAAVRGARGVGESFSVGVGLASGEVVVGAIGSEERLDFTVIGDVVNTGARLCSAAEADEVLVTQAVHDAWARGDGTSADAKGAVQLDPHAPLALKGKSELVPVWSARSGPLSG